MPRCVVCDKKTSGRFVRTVKIAESEDRVTVAIVYVCRKHFDAPSDRRLRNIILKKREIIEENLEEYVPVKTLPIWLFVAGLR